MINMLTKWQGAVEINGKIYESIQSAMSGFTAPEGSICIKLYPKNESPIKSANNAPEAEDAPIAEPTVYRISVKKYMTEQASAGFDFMLKFNNDVPMPMRTMVGTIEKETRGMYYMHLKGMAEATCTCMRCGRVLTNPVSKVYGIGPECMAKLGMVRMDIEDVESITKKLQEIEWTGWVIKSAITEKVEVN